VLTVAAVENMSYFDCPGGSRHRPFGPGLLGKNEGGGKGADDTDDGGAASSLFGPDGPIDPTDVIQLPISSLANDAAESGVPLALSRPPEAEEELRAFGDLASAVSERLLRLQYLRSRIDDAGEDSWTVTFGDGSELFRPDDLRLSSDDPGKRLVLRAFTELGATEMHIDGEDLRRTDPETGERLQEEEVPPTPGGGGGMVQHFRSLRLFPARVEKSGRYGYAVEWADGASVIYSLKSLALAAGGTIQRKGGEGP